MSCYLGIDPGKSGGLAIISPKEVHVWKMPSTERDLWDLAKNLYASWRPVAMLEKVHSMPTDSAKGAFTFGMNYGLLRGCLTALGVPWDDVTPQKWQKALGCLTKGDKNITKAKAQQLFPSVKRITHATADALLIAEYCRRTHE